ASTTEKGVTFWYCSARGRGGAGTHERTSSMGNVRSRVRLALARRWGCRGAKALQVDRQGWKDPLLERVARGRGRHGPEFQCERNRGANRSVRRHVGDGGAAFARRAAPRPGSL